MVKESRRTRRLAPGGRGALTWASARTCRCNRWLRLDDCCNTRAVNRAFLVVVLVVVGTASPPPAPDYPYTKLADPRFKELMLGVGDVVGISVYDNKQFDTDATVRADGTITLPLIGDLKAAGETPSALRDH